VVVPEHLFTATSSSLVEILEELLASGQSGELFGSHGQLETKICVYQGKIAWARCSAHGQHLGDVLSKECGLADADLRRALLHCRDQGLRLGEGLVELDLVSIADLHRCLRLHATRHLVRGLELAPHVFEWTWELRPYRYDTQLLFELGDLLTEAALEICVAGFPALRYAMIYDFVRAEAVAECGSSAEMHNLAKHAQAMVEATVEMGGIAHCASSAKETVFLHKLPWTPDQLVCIWSAGGSRALGHFLTHAHRMLEF
jgi:hypothetical protein